MEKPFGLYHSTHSVVTQIFDWPEENGEINLLRKIIRRGSNGVGEFSELTLDELNNVETCIKSLINEIEEMKRLLKIRTVRVDIHTKLLLITSMISKPFEMVGLKSPTSEYYVVSVLESWDIYLQLQNILAEINREIIKKRRSSSL